MCSPSMVFSELKVFKFKISMHSSVLSDKDSLPENALIWLPLVLMYIQSAVCPKRVSFVYEKKAFLERTICIAKPALVIH